jgi:hypothetical protein
MMPNQFFCHAGAKKRRPEAGYPACFASCFAKSLI